MTVDNLVEELDALIVGGGFGGVYLLYKLREAGFKAKIYEWGTGLGGVWHWNNYPGARVDTFAPSYEYSIEALWKDWAWKEKYPDWQQLKAYFDYVDKKLDISKDVRYNTFVSGAEYNSETNEWNISTKNGLKAKAKYFLIANGFAAKKYVPNIPGLDKFQGDVFHSVDWPKQYDVAGKRVAVVGTGSTGVQIIQTVGPVAKELVVFQRTPNPTLPMRQEQWTREQQDAQKVNYPAIYESRLKTFGGITFDLDPRKALEASEEERNEKFEELYNLGGFHLWLGTFSDVLFNKDANKIAYEFWLKKTRPRIKDLKKADTLAPLVPAHPFGTKRVALEQNYYDVVNQSNVTIVDVSKNPIVEATETSVKLADGQEFELDLLALATGFDAFTGGFGQIDIRGENGVTIQEKWKGGIKTHLGMATSGFPNMFYLYGPKSPSGVTNGPTFSEVQGDFVVKTLEYLRERNIKKITASEESETAWTQLVSALADQSLFPDARSWYNGDNVPGKTREFLMYLGGLPTYINTLSGLFENDFDGFNLS